MAEVNSSTQKTKKIWIFWVAIFAILIGIISFLIFKYGDFINSFLYPPKENVNVLVLGKGGVGHDAPDLTDTIILASVSDEKINLISLPRDIWVPEIRAKLNSAYYWGKVKNESFKLVDDSVNKITGIKADYNLVVDFSVFKDLVNSLEGIEVDVKNSFTDEKYPIVGKENDLCEGEEQSSASRKEFKCRYETISFEKGETLMDGETALKFVRSRNAEGDEGTDLAREARQQLVVTAIKNKTLTPEVYLNPFRMKSLSIEILGSIETDMDQKALGGLARKMLNAKGVVSSDVVPEELLIHPPVSQRYDNQYVFIPKAGTWDEVRDWVGKIVK